MEHELSDLERLPEESEESPIELTKISKPNVFVETATKIVNPVLKGVYVNTELYNLVIARVGSNKKFSLAVNQALIEWMEKDGTWS